MIIPITGFYVSIAGLILLYLSFLVVQVRIRDKEIISDGKDGNPILFRNVRMFGNFVEYTPIALLLLAVAELNDVHENVLHGSAMLLIFGRLAHAYGIRHFAGENWQRMVGMIATYLSILVLSLCNLYLLY